VRGQSLADVCDVGRRLAGDLREVVTTQSRWLFDLARGRFQRCARTQPTHQALAFGQWADLTSVSVVARQLLVVEAAGAPTVRAEIDTPAETSNR
jgi:hypothetical protein